MAGFGTIFRQAFKKSLELTVLAVVASVGAAGGGIYAVSSVVGGARSPAPTSTSTSADPAPSTAGSPPAPDTSSLTADSASAMVLAYSLQNCRMDWNQDWSNQLASSGDWEGQLESKGYTLSSSTAAADVLTYSYLGTSLVVKVTKPTGYVPNYAISACLYVPSSITVLDTTVDAGGKTATVIFKYGPYAPSPFSAEPVARVLFNLHAIESGGDYSKWTAEHRAYFEKLDATGWRVGSVQ